MQNPLSVITTAVKGIGEDVAVFFGVSPARFYQILEKDFYGKTKRLIRCIAAVDKERVRAIKADMDALFAEILGEPKAHLSAADMHRETGELVQSMIENQPPEVIKKEARDVAVLCHQIIESDKDEIQQDYFGARAQ